MRQAFVAFILGAGCALGPWWAGRFRRQMKGSTGEGAVGLRSGVVGIVAAAGAGFGAVACLAAVGLRSITLAAAVCVLASAAGVDLLERVIPDELVVGCGVVGLAAFIGGLPPALGSRVLGAVAAGGVMLVARAAAREGLGGGDVKLALAAGLLLGARAAVLFLCLAFAGAALFCLVCLVLGICGLRDRIPLGPFLCGAALVSLAWGDGLLAAAARLIQIRL